MSYIDIAIIAFIAIFAIKGLINGFAKSLIKLIAFVGCMLLALVLARIVGDLLLDIPEVSKIVLGDGSVGFSLRMWLEGFLPKGLDGLTKAISANDAEAAMLAAGGGDGIFPTLLMPFFNKIAKLDLGSATLYEAICACIAGDLFLLVLAVAMFFVIRLVTAIFTTIVWIAFKGDHVNGFGRLIGFFLGGAKAAAYVVVVFMLISYVGMGADLKDFRKELENSVIGQPVSEFVFEMTDKGFNSGSSYYNKYLELAGFRSEGEQSLALRASIKQNLNLFEAAGFAEGWEDHYLDEDYYFAEQLSKLVDFNTQAATVIDTASLTLDDLDAILASISEGGSTLEAYKLLLSALVAFDAANAGGGTATVSFVVPTEEGDVAIEDTVEYKEVLSRLVLISSQINSTKLFTLTPDSGEGGSTQFVFEGITDPKVEEIDEVKALVLALADIIKGSEADEDFGHKTAYLVDTYVANLASKINSFRSFAELESIRELVDEDGALYADFEALAGAVADLGDIDIEADAVAYATQLDVVNGHFESIRTLVNNTAVLKLGTNNANMVYPQSPVIAALISSITNSLFDMSSKLNPYSEHEAFGVQISELIALLQKASDNTDDSVDKDDLKQLAEFVDSKSALSANVDALVAVVDAFSAEDDPFNVAAELTKIEVLLGGSILLDIADQADFAFTPVEGLEDTDADRVVWLLEQWIAKLDGQFDETNYYREVNAIADVFKTINTNITDDYANSTALLELLNDAGAFDIELDALYSTLKASTIFEVDVLTSLEEIKTTINTDFADLLDEAFAYPMNIVDLEAAVDGLMTAAVGKLDTAIDVDTAESDYYDNKLTDIKALLEGIAVDRTNANLDKLHALLGTEGDLIKAIDAVIAEIAEPTQDEAEIFAAFAEVKTVLSEQLELTLNYSEDPLVTQIKAAIDSLVSTLNDQRGKGFDSQITDIVNALSTYKASVNESIGDKAARAAVLAKVDDASNLKNQISQLATAIGEDSVNAADLTNVRTALIDDLGIADFEYRDTTADDIRIAIDALIAELGNVATNSQITDIVNALNSFKQTDIDQNTNKASILTAVKSGGDLYDAIFALTDVFDGTSDVTAEFVEVKTQINAFIDAEFDYTPADTTVDDIKAAASALATALNGAVGEQDGDYDDELAELAAVFTALEGSIDDTVELSERQALLAALSDGGDVYEEIYALIDALEADEADQDDLEAAAAAIVSYVDDQFAFTADEGGDQGGEESGDEGDE